MFVSITTSTLKPFILASLFHRPEGLATHGVNYMHVFMISNHTRVRPTQSGQHIEKEGVIVVL